MSLFADLVELEGANLDRALDATELGVAVQAEWGRLMADDARCTELAADFAYRHPNGFTKVVVATSTSGRVARLHFWTAGHVDANPHSHRWDLRSRVITGGLENLIYTRHAGEGFEECSAVSPSAPGLPYLHTPIGRVDLRLGAVHRLTAGDSYFQAFDMIHVTRIPPGVHTVTLVITEPECRRVSTAYVTSASRLGAVAVGEVAPAALRSIFEPAGSVR